MRFKRIARTLGMMAGVTWCVAGHAQRVEVADPIGKAAEEIVAQLESAVAGVSGPVVRVVGDDLYVNLGRKHGVRVGQRLQVFERGEEVTLPDGTKTHVETFMGEIQIMRVQTETACVCKVSKLEPNKAVAEGQAAYAAVRVPSPLAIVDFVQNRSPTSAEVSRMGVDLASAIQTRLARNNVLGQVLERYQLGRILGELKVGLNDLFDGTVAKQPGRLLTAHSLLIGELRPVEPAYEVVAKVVDVENGGVLLSASAMAIGTAAVNDRFAEVAYAWAGGEVAEGATGAVAVRGIVYVGPRGSYVQQLLQSANLDVTQRPALDDPEVLAAASCVVVDDATVLDPSLAPVLEGLLRAGKGVCLTGETPMSLAQASRPGPARMGTRDLSTISQWFGVTQLGEPGAAGWSRRDTVEVIAGTTRPFGTTYARGQQLYRQLAGANWLCFRLDYPRGNRVVPIALAGVSNWHGYGVAFSNRYADGRLYWQSFVPDEPDWRQLGKLFVAAVRWAAGDPVAEPRAPRTDTKARPVREGAGRSALEKILDLIFK